MIEKLESAGLGFFIKGEETKQKLGKALQHLLEWSIKHDLIRKGPIAYFMCRFDPTASSCVPCAGPPSQHETTGV